MSDPFLSERFAQGFIARESRDFDFWCFSVKSYEWYCGIPLVPAQRVREELAVVKRNIAAYIHPQENGDEL